MEKLKQIMKKNMADELSAFIILGAVTLAILVTIGIYSLTRYNEVMATSGKLGFQEEISENNEESITNFTSVENINSVEELQKLNEKELKEAEKKEDKKTEQESTPSYYIKVNYGAQVVTVYGKDSKGNYTVPVKAMVCSTGTYTPTSGVYKIPNKFRWLDMIGDVYAQYCTQIVGDILFHSVPYLTKYDHSSLEWWAYDQLGTRASLGCIRLTCKDAKWIYDNCRIGTQVEFYSSSNPGPLGKPSARKISDAPSYVRGWDPTDSASGNPWKKYLEEQNKENNKKPTKPTEPSKPVNEMVNDIIVNDIINDIEANDIEVNDIIVNDVIVNETTGEEDNINDQVNGISI